MLLDLAQWLSKDIRAFSVFNYLTLRAVLATLTAFSSPTRTTLVGSTIPASSRST